MIEKQLRKVAKIMEDYGLRVLYNVFECSLTEEEFLEMKKDRTYNRNLFNLKPAFFNKLLPIFKLNEIVFIF